MSTLEWTSTAQHGFRSSLGRQVLADKYELFPVQALRAPVLTEAPRFEHMVVSTTGRMVPMQTMAPGTFVEFKRWMAEAAPQRDPLKRRRDLRQSEIVQALLNEGRPVA